MKLEEDTRIFLIVNIKTGGFHTKCCGVFFGLVVWKMRKAKTPNYIFYRGGFHGKTKSVSLTLEESNILDAKRSASEKYASPCDNSGSSNSSRTTAVAATAEQQQY